MCLETDGQCNNIEAVTMASGFSNDFYGDCSVSHGKKDDNNGNSSVSFPPPNGVLLMGATTDESHTDGHLTHMAPPCVTAMDLSPHMSDISDDKKRPLSVSSVTSSVSSSSSLPRHQRKKLATCVMTTSGQTPQLNNMSIEEDFVHSEDILCLTGANGNCDIRSNNSVQNSKKDIITGCSESKDSSSSASDNHSLSHDAAENFSENGSSDISDLSNLSSASMKCDISAHKTETSENKDSDCTSNVEDKRCRRFGVTKDYTPLCDPHGRAPRTTLPTVTTQETLFEAARAWSSYTYKVIQEILVTERVYVRDLQDIVEGYVTYLADCQVVQNRLSKQELQLLFGNITHIYVFNRELLENLEQCGCDPVKIAQCFVDKSDGFNIYTDYCTNYPSSVEVLTQVMCDSELADIFKTQQMHLQHGLPLGSYLLKPVQRILKYHLLLQNLVNNFDSRQAGVETVRGALECMTNVAEHTNEMKRRHERAVHIQEIQSLLFGWSGDDLTTCGELLLEDTFRMHGAKAYRHLYLFEKVLIIAKKKEDGNLLVKESIQCSNLMVIESVPGEPLSFHVIPFDNPRLQYTLQCRNLDQKREWCQNIKRLILENFSAVIPDKAKELVMTLGKSKEEQEYAQSHKEEHTGKSNKTHTAPEYLERRRHRRKSSTTLLDLSLLKGQRVFRMRRQTSADGRIQVPESSPQSKRLLMKSTSAENMLDLNESPLEHTEEQPKLQRAESLESIHSLRNGDLSDREPITKISPSPKTSSLCSAAQSARRVQSRELLDNIDTSLTVHEIDITSHDTNHDHDNVSYSLSSKTALPSDCISPSGMRKVSSDITSQRDSIGYIDDSDSANEDGFHKHAFFRSLSSPNDSILKAVADKTGIILKDPDIPSPTDPMRSFANDAFEVLPQLKETKIDSDAIKCESELNVMHLSMSDSLSDLGKDSLRKKPPVNMVKSSPAKSKLLSADKSVQNRILYDSDISNSLEILGVHSQKQLAKDSVKNHAKHHIDRKLSKTLSTPTSSRQSLCSKSSHAVLMTSDLNRDGSRLTLDDIDSCGKTDPWTLRKDLSNRLQRSVDKERRNRNAPTRRSKSNVGDLSVLKALITNKHDKLHRASSCSSLDNDENESSPKNIESENNVGDAKSDLEPVTGSAQAESPGKVNVKKLGGSNSFREKFRNIVTPQRHPKASRFATPPRDAMNKIRSAISGDKHNSMDISDIETAERETVLNGERNESMLDQSFDIPSPRGSNSKSSTLVSRDSTLDWSALDEIENSESLCTHAGSNEGRSSRPRSYNEHMQHITLQSGISTSTIGNESIMSSLKNAMASLTSRLTRMGNSSASRNTNSSPAHGFIRSRSLGAEYDARIRPIDVNNSPSPHLNCRTSPSRSLKPSSKHTPERRKEKRNKLMFSLQRAYSERVKKRGRSRSITQVDQRNSKLFLAEPSLYESTTSISAAERLAESKPQGVGSYTLRKPKSKAKSNKQDQENEVNSPPTESAIQKPECEMQSTSDNVKPKSEMRNYSIDKNSNGQAFQKEQNSFISNKINTSNPPTPTSLAGSFKVFQGSNPSLRDGLFLPSDIMDLVNKSGEIPVEDCVSLQSYYEHTLDANLDSDSMKDCVICTDDGEFQNFDSESLAYSPEVPLPTIFDTVQEYAKNDKHSTMLANGSQFNNNFRAVQNTVQNLEVASTTSETKTYEAHKVRVKDRSRELNECAMLSRIRQDSCDGTIDGSHDDLTTESTPSICNCDDFDNSLESCIDVLKDGAQHVNPTCPVHSSPRKGWVKQVISQIQNGYLSAEN